MPRLTNDPIARQDRPDGISSKRKQFRESDPHEFVLRYTSSVVHYVGLDVHKDSISVAYALG
jgi:hypothetical protein